jgi:hypothetical protein
MTVPPTAITSVEGAGEGLEEMESDADEDMVSEAVGVTLAEGDSEDVGVTDGDGLLVDVLEGDTDRVGVRETLGLGEGENRVTRIASAPTTSDESSRVEMVTVDP